MSPFAVPPGAIDAHVHLFDPARFAFALDTPYCPPPAECGDARDLDSVLAAHGFAGALLVNPSSGYGDDNTCMLDALARGGGRHRGIARVALDVRPARLRTLARRGVVGIRRDLVGEGTGQLADPAFTRLARTLADQDLVLEIHCEAGQAIAVAQAADRLPCRLVIDHCGRPDPRAGVRAPAFRALLGLAELPRIALKISGAFRFGHRAPSYDDADVAARALIAAFGPDRCVWGSDWPFVRMPHRIDYGTSLAILARWVPDARTRRRILVDTPRHWFGFDPWRKS